MTGTPGAGTPALLRSVPDSASAEFANARWAPPTRAWVPGSRMIAYTAAGELPAAPPAVGAWGLLFRAALTVVRFAATIVWWSTGELLPAASVTVTLRSCGPSASIVVSTGTLTATEVLHGCAERNSAAPLASVPTAAHWPELVSGVALYTGCPSIATVTL